MMVGMEQKRHSKYGTLRTSLSFIRLHLTISS